MIFPRSEVLKNLAESEDWRSMSKTPDDLAGDLSEIRRALICFDPHALFVNSQKMIKTLLVFLFLNSIALVAETSEDPLWRKAVAVARTNAGWIPGLVVVRSEVLHKGKIEAVREWSERSTLGKTGEVIAETVKILEDGEDVTVKEKKEHDRDEKKKAISAPKNGRTQQGPGGG